MTRKLDKFLVGLLVAELRAKFSGFPLKFQRGVRKKSKESSEAETRLS